MTYTRTNWVDDGAPPISAANLNKLEIGVEDAHIAVADITGLPDPSSADRFLVSRDAPVPVTTRPWSTNGYNGLVNYCKLNAIILTPAASSEYNATDTMDKALDESISTYWHSSSVASSWWSVDFGSAYRVVPTRIAVENRVFGGHPHIRNYAFEGSVDGSTWIRLYEVANTTLASGAWSSWVVTTSTYFRYFRVISTGLDSMGANYHVFASFEVWGTLYSSVTGIQWHQEPLTSTGHTIQNEGSNLTARSKLNFVGASVTATDDAANDATLVTIEGGGGGSNHYIQATEPTMVDGDIWTKATIGAANYNSLVLSDSPLVYVKMDAAGAVDSSGNSRTPTASGGITSSVAPLITVGNSWSLDRGRLAWDTPESWLNGLAGFTVEVWAKFTDIGANQTIFQRDNASTARHFALNRHFQGKLDWLTWNAAGSLSILSSATTIAYATRYHIVCVYDSVGGASKIYINGVLDASAAISGVSRSVTLPLYFGALSPDFINANVDEVAIYGTALSDAKILSHYNTGATGPTPTTADALYQRVNGTTVLVPTHVIQDEGAALTTRSKLNFVGAGVTATDDAANDATKVTITGGGGGGGVTSTVGPVAPSTPAVGDLWFKTA